jgi:hypothetical protein
MIEKFLSLFERLVVAVEAIASKAGPLVVQPSEQATPAEGPKPSRSRAAADKKKDEPKDPAPTTDNSFDFLGAAPKKYERGDVKAALEKLVAKSGTSTAFTLFQSITGVQTLNDVPEDAFAKVIKAVEDELAKK